MKPEQVYSLLVEANPIPDGDALPDIGARLQVVDTRSTTMQTQTVERPISDSTRRPRRLIPALAAVVAVIVAGVSLLLLNGGDDDTAREEREGAALSVMEEFYGALNSGDLATIERLTGSDEADSTMWAFNTVGTATYPRAVEDCAVTGSTNSLYVDVACTIVVTDPVHVANGVTRWVEPWQVFDDGGLQWLPIQTPGFFETTRAMRDYLRAEYPEEYAEVCDPSRYTFGSINFSEGIALTPRCAQLIVPLSDQIADWIRAGKP